MWKFILPELTVTVNPTPVIPSSAATDRNNLCLNDGGNINLSNFPEVQVLPLVGYAGGCGITSIGNNNPLAIAAPASTTTYYVRWRRLLAETLLAIVC